MLYFWDFDKRNKQTRGRNTQKLTRKVLDEDKYVGDQCGMQLGVSIECGASGIVIEKGSAMLVDDGK